MTGSIRAVSISTKALNRCWPINLRLVRCGDWLPRLRHMRFAVVLSAAFTAPDLSQILLRGNDFSYGIYLYHMPVVNAYLAWSAAVAPDWRGAVSAFLVTIVLAILSWFLVEKPALAYKSRPGTGTMPDLSKGAA